MVTRLVSASNAQFLRAMFTFSPIQTERNKSAMPLAGPSQVRTKGRNTYFYCYASFSSPQQIMHGLIS